MKFFFLIFVLGAFVASGLSYQFAGHSQGLGVLVGSMIAFANVVGLQFFWSRILGKKSVALNVFAIVLKYSLLLGVCYAVTRQEAIPSLWFGVGFLLTTILVSCAGLLVEKKAENEPENKSEIRL